jgi:hypothetical protein
MVFAWYLENRWKGFLELVDHIPDHLCDLYRCQLYAQSRVLSHYNAAPIQLETKELATLTNLVADIHVG